jgi:endoglucanase
LPTGRAGPVGKCVNMSNMLEAPHEGDWGGRAIAEDDFRIIRAAGFTTVRIPVRWSAHAMTVAPYTIDPAFLMRVHHVVDMADRAGLNVMLNMHHYEELFATPEKEEERFAGIWRQIAASFADAPPNVWFELINEPHDKLSAANLDEVINPALAKVRQTNATRPVVIGGQNWSGVDSLASLELPDDPAVVPTFHYYEPFQFTHQGATFITPTPPLGRRYGTAADYARLAADVAKVKQYMARTGRVPVMGEFGATDNPGVPLEDRIKWYRTVSSAFASIGVQGCVWGYASGFKVRDGDHWIPGLVESLKTTTTP